MIATPLKPLQEFLKRPDIDQSPALELLERGVQQKPMATYEHSELQLFLVNSIRAASQDYKAYQELRCNVAGQSLVPDVVVVPATDKPKGHHSGAPVWLIEIRSPDQTTAKLTSKIIHCLEHGSQLGWVIDLQRQRITVWRNGEDETYTGPQVVPGMDLLNLTVAEILSEAG
ncbi:MAG: Uma2 family endonuclease [Cyanobacteria bacterium P01_H01_bin.121]